MNTQRFCVFESAQSTKWICVCSARTAEHAVRIARAQLGDLITSTAYAVLA